MNGDPTPLLSSKTSFLRELPPEFDASAQEAMRTKARRVKPDHESMGGMSDEWLANELRMLSRHDLWHEAFCTAARDRIMRLSMQLAEARGVIDALKGQPSETYEPFGHVFQHLSPFGGSYWSMDGGAENGHTPTRSREIFVKRESNAVKANEKPPGTKLPCGCWNNSDGTGRGWCGKHWAERDAL